MISSLALEVAWDGPQQRTVQPALANLVTRPGEGGEVAWDGPQQRTVEPALANLVTRPGEGGEVA